MFSLIGIMFASSRNHSASMTNSLSGEHSIYHFVGAILGYFRVCTCARFDDRSGWCTWRTWFLLSLVRLIFLFNIAVFCPVGHFIHFPTTGFGQFFELGSLRIVELLGFFSLFRR